MVTTTCFSPSASSRRFASFRSPYLPTYVERKAAESSHRESSCNIIFERYGAADDSKSQRKRIAVACGRCRKRKIRCSGDAGNGQPCINCKNAGVKPCQFLRDSSQEVAHVKASGAFSYNIDVSRFIQARSSTAAPPISMAVNTFHGGMGLGDIHTTPGRRLGMGMGVEGGALGGGLEGGGMGAASTHGAYGNKAYYSSGGWGSGYAESPGVDYGICPPPFQTAADSPFETSTYRIASSQATTTSNPTGLVYLDAEEAYGYGGMSVAGVRQAASSGGEAVTACLPFIPRSLPSSSERLPVMAVAGGRLTSSSSSSPQSTTVYRTDGDYKKNNAKQAGIINSSPAAATVPEGFHSYESLQLAFSSHQNQHSSALVGPLGRSGDHQPFVAAPPPMSEGLLTAARGDAALRTPVPGSEASYILSEQTGLPSTATSSSSLSLSSLSLSSAMTTAVFHHPQQQKQQQKQQGQVSPPQPQPPPPSGPQSDSGASSDGSHSYIFYHHRSGLQEESGLCGDSGTAPCLHTRSAGKGKPAIKMHP